MNELVFPNINIENLAKWEGDFSPLECIEIKDETHNVKSFTFKSKLDAWFHFLPGQHTTLFLNIDKSNSKKIKIGNKLNPAAAGEGTPTK